MRLKFAPNRRSKPNESGSEQLRTRSKANVVDPFELSEQETETLQFLRAMCSNDSKFLDGFI